MEKLDGKTFWNKVDRELLYRGITLTELSKHIGVGKATIYKQRDRQQIPKYVEVLKIEKTLRTTLFSSSSSEFNEYIPYLEQAPEWKIKAIRQLLEMPEAEQEEIYG